jgi:hypothetical protein
MTIDAKTPDEPVTVPMESPPSKSTPPIPKGTPPWIKNILAWANASKGPIAAAAALVTALGAFFKPPDHSVTKTAYETLSSGIKDLSDEQKRDHEDLVRLRGYMDGLTRAGVPSLEAPPPAAPQEPAPAATHGRLAGGVRRMKPPSLAFGGGESRPLQADAPADSAIAAMEAVPPPPMAPEPPPVHLEQKRMELPQFEAILKK